MSILPMVFYIYVPQFTVETYCFVDGRYLFKQSQSVIYHWNQYDEAISNKCRSVRLFVCNANKKAYSFIIHSRIIIRISGERVWHSLQENKAIFSKHFHIFKNFRPNFRKTTYLRKNACSSFIINSRIIISISDERNWCPLQEN